MAAVGDRATEVRHHARLQIYGLTRLLTPVYRRLARRERTVVLEALKASFEHPA